MTQSTLKRGERGCCDKRGRERKAQVKRDRSFFNLFTGEVFLEERLHGFLKPFWEGGIWGNFMEG